MPNWPELLGALPPITQDEDGLSEQEIPEDVRSALEPLLERLAAHRYGRTGHKGTAEPITIRVVGDRVELIYEVRGCGCCPAPRDRHSIPLSRLEAGLAGIQAHFALLDRARDAHVEACNAFDAAERTRAEIRMLRALTAKYPEYLDPNVALPELPADPYRRIRPYVEPRPAGMTLFRGPADAIPPRLLWTIEQGDADEG